MRANWHQTYFALHNNYVVLSVTFPGIRFEKNTVEGNVYR